MFILFLTHGYYGNIEKKTTPYDKTKTKDINLKL